MATLGARLLQQPGLVQLTRSSTLLYGSGDNSMSSCLGSGFSGICQLSSRGGGRTGRLLVVVGRAGGSRPPAGARRRPRPSGQRRTDQEVQNDGPLMNSDIRTPTVRLLDEEQNMVGIVSIQEALERSRTAELDLVMISPEAEPPVVRIMNYSKYKYELQKKKREAQKKAAANRQELKELKMRYNIDTHDYDVRLRAAQRFLKDGDKVKVVCQFKGREMEFKDLAFKLFERFVSDIGELGVIESKMAIEGRSMQMLIGPNKILQQKVQAQAQSVSDKIANV
ncbi:unnamed protein product [Sphagnum jensenii]|uniref:Translation initiation factor IF-3 n=1 Tax=Sphagnum jensenii TaxID=128206 RepID=A0ABP1BM01_9BRYO